jgi:Golgi SNAP receptor complex protein 2
MLPKFRSIRGRKNAQRRILDIANSLGLSTSVLKFIERRGVQDKWILYGGMVATGLILLAIIYYLA